MVEVVGILKHTFLSWINNNLLLGLTLKFMSEIIADVTFYQ
jgi:hypothetical protein